MVDLDIGRLLRGLAPEGDRADRGSEYWAAAGQAREQISAFLAAAGLIDAGAGGAAGTAPDISSVG